MKKTESSNERKDMCSAICIYQLPDLLIEKVNREGMTSMKIHIMNGVRRNQADYYAASTDGRT